MTFCLNTEAYHHVGFHRLFLSRLSYVFLSALQLSSVESLCVPPYARDSRTASSALKLLHSQKNTDLIFEIIIAHGMCLSIAVY